MGSPKIYGLIPQVMDEIGAIGKDRKNAQQNYFFRGIDDLYNAVQSALIKHMVFCAPEMIDMSREERTNKSGGTLIYTVLTMRYTFYAEDGSSFTCVTVGEAMDSGDKSCNKAMSAAQKYALLQVFCIPTEEPKDTENETHEVAPKPSPKQPPKPTEKPAGTGEKKELTETHKKLLALMQEIYKGDKSRMTLALQSLTEWTGSDGKRHEGKMSLYEVSEKMAQVAYGKLKKIAEDMKASTDIPWDEMGGEK